MNTWNRRLFAATGDDIVSIATDGDQTDVVQSLTGVGAQCLAADPNDSRTLYCGCRSQGLLRSSDGGSSWQSAHLPQSAVFSVAVSAADSSVYAGCEPSALFCSADRGTSWRELTSLTQLPSAPSWSFPPRPWTSHVRWIAPHPADARLVLVGIELGGLMRTDDGGRSFEDHRPGAQRDVHAIAWHPRAHDRAYEAAGGGAAQSFDGGQTWQEADAGLDRHYVWGLAPDSSDPDRWYVSASTGPRAAHGSGSADACIYRFDGSRFNRLPGLSQPLDAMPYALLSVDSELYAGLADGTLYASHDGGSSWRTLDLGPQAPGRIVALTCAQ